LYGEAEPELQSVFCSPTCESKGYGRLGGAAADNSGVIEDEPPEGKPMEEHFSMLAIFLFTCWVEGENSTIRN